VEKQEKQKQKNRKIGTKNKGRVKENKKWMRRESDERERKATWQTGRAID
jgi:hypothetical protein